MSDAKARTAKERPEEPGGDDYGRRDDEEAAEAASRQAEVAPVHGDPGFDPVTSVWDVSRMAGYGDSDGAYETTQGIDDYVMGRKHAMQEMQVESETEGGPLDLDPFESLYSDDVGFGDIGIGLMPGEELNAIDWRREERSGGMMESEEAAMFDESASLLVGGGR